MPLYVLACHMASRAARGVTWRRGGAACACAQEGERARDRYKAEIKENEGVRKDIQGRVASLGASNQRSQAFLNLLSTFRLQALHLQELKFQMAVRDQVGWRVATARSAASRCARTI